MSDRYARFAASRIGRTLVKRTGLPNPTPLRRYRDGNHRLAGPVLFGGDGRLGDAIRKVLADLGAEVHQPDLDHPVSSTYGALVFDATAITSPAQLDSLYAFFHPYARTLVPSGRVILLGTPPAAVLTSGEQIAQRALEGFVRSVGKEFGHGTTAQLVHVGIGAERRIESTLRFLLSSRSAYVSGQVIAIGAAGKPSPYAVSADWDRPHDGRVALVTGAARGIGAAIAEVLARDGASVICLDVPASGEALTGVANTVGGSAVQLDLTTLDAPDRLADFIEARYGKVDVLVHNAGITRDRTLAKMPAELWRSVLDVNLMAPLRVNDVLVGRDLIPAGGRIVGVSSIAGLAGNPGQTNYATSKAGVLGVVESQAAELGKRGITINAVAPGFIETEMTAKMPLLPRLAGRRLNSLSQGGLPVDVAETIAWIAAPGSEGLSGNVVRVCGQSLVGA